jgi:hypothetical protein
MSCTLVVKKIPKRTTEWCFKLALRDKLYEKFGDRIDTSAIPFLEGVMVHANEDDSGKIQAMIDALCAGFELHLEMQC